METFSTENKQSWKLPLRSHQKNDIRISKLKWFSDDYPAFYEYDFETSKQAYYQHNLPHIFACHIICMCPLPDNKLFGFSNWRDWSEDCGTLFIIDESNDIQTIQHYSLSITSSYSWNENKITFMEDEKNVLQTFLRGSNYTDSSGTYYNNFIYISMKNIIGFDLINQRWHTIVKRKDEQSWCTSISFNNLILALEYKSENIYILDLLTLSISPYSLPIAKRSAKMLFSFENVVYLVDFYGKILESSIDDPFNWKIIKDFKFIGGYSPYSYSAFCNNCWYMIFDDYQVYSFELNQKNLKKLDLSLEGRLNY